MNYQYSSLMHFVGISLLTALWKRISEDNKLINKDNKF